MCHSFMKYAYKEDGTIASFTSSVEGLPATDYQKQMVMDVTEYLLSGETGCSFYQMLHRTE